MTDRLQLALEITISFWQPFAIFAACGLFAVAYKSFHGVWKDLVRASRSMSGDSPGRSIHGSGFHRPPVESSTSEEGSFVVELIFVLSALCFVGGFLLAFGPIAALFVAGTALLLAGAYAVGDKARGEDD